MATIEADATRSQTGLAYSEIRKKIIRGQHRPGEKLKIQDLAKGLDVSPSAVREALSRLVPERLVVSREQRGFVVAPLSLDDLRDLTELRCDIEEIALRRAVKKGDLAWEADLVAAAHRLRAMHDSVEDEDVAYDEWRKCHIQLHAALIAGSANERLMALHSQLFEQAERYRYLSSYVEPDRDVKGEHDEIVEAALARDADRLVALSLNHIRTTSDLIARTAEDQGLMVA